MDQYNTEFNDNNWSAEGAANWVKNLIQDHIPGDKIDFLINELELAQDYGQF
jgi:hypothetical protein